MRLFPGTMMSDVPSSSPSQHRFATTSWTRVLKAARNGSGVEFATLCQQYWYPLYAFLRRSGISASDSEDTVQAFFAWLLESKALERADPQRGRFRSFLLVLLRQFQARQHKHESAAKRKPAGPIVSIDRQDAEARYQMHLFHTGTAEKLFEQAWAVTIIEQTMQQLREEMVRAGKGEQFETLRGMMTGQRDVSGRDAGRQLAISEGAVRVAVHRMKNRYGELLRQQVAMTLHDEEDVDIEIKELLSMVTT